MLPYFSCFVLSLFLSACSEFVCKRKNRITATFLACAAVLVLSIMAGIRSFDVGTDNRFYILPMFNRAQLYNTSFRELWTKNVEDVEILFLVLEYIAVRLFGSPHFVTFMLSLLTNSFAYMGIVKHRDKMSVAFAWLCYCLIYFNVSLNLMRQSVSVAILFYLFSDLKELNWNRVILFTFFASMFHISGLIGFFFYAVYLAICRRSKICGLRQVLFLLFMLLPVAVPFAIRMIITFGGLNHRYYMYYDSPGNVAIGNLLFRILCLISFGLLCFRSGKESEKSQHYFLLYTGIMNSLFVINNSVLYIRLREYFDIFTLLYIPEGLRVYSQRSGLRALVTVLIVVAMIVYWYYIFVYMDSGETYPYRIDPLWMKRIS